MKAYRDGPVVSLPRSDGLTVDVFTGKGWSNHTVFEVKDGRITRMVKGKALTAEEFKLFKSRL